jgi:hypothetical protein
VRRFGLQRFTPTMGLKKLRLPPVLLSTRIYIDDP